MHARLALPGLCLALATALAAPAAHAGLFDKKPETSAEEAARDGLPAVTVWVDATWGFRNQGSANALSRAHKAFADHGYRVESVEPYIENGDLQGFFVTYQRP
ncbi:hypothetical protein [Coralloluteibacterium stylophorae]|uniref:Uncharacterized protein n=1 Tax=Coralloluteibacterium stylophorae TaxID=1776034 RepID=A0A8J7VXS4_9GAMM|nr:hypothetical protein [Coralloluteibacterium stylophorae]MBS7458733.1 hypothetical protein [Coralloluteibacterium stylophorae]